jgi:hypothetical protein
VTRWPLALVAHALSATLVSGCCFLNLPEPPGYTAPPSYDDPGAETEARRYFLENVDALVADLTTDAGTGGSGGCSAGMGALALSMFVVVLSRGHAGADMATEAAATAPACFRSVTVIVALANGVWRGVGITATTMFEEVVTFGAPGTYVADVTPRALPSAHPPSRGTGGSGSSGSHDSDWGSDEWF